MRRRPRVVWQASRNLEEQSVKTAQPKKPREVDPDRGHRRSPTAQRSAAGTARGTVAPATLMRRSCRPERALGPATFPFALAAFPEDHLWSPFREPAPGPWGAVLAAGLARSPGPRPPVPG